MFSVKVALSHVNDEISGLKADLSTSPSRREFEELKSKVDKRYPLSENLPISHSDIPLNNQLRQTTVLPCHDDFPMTLGKGEKRVGVPGPKQGAGDSGRAWDW
jgi:hypothetical protein